MHSKRWVCAALAVWLIAGCSNPTTPPLPLDTEALDEQAALEEAPPTEPSMPAPESAPVTAPPTPDSPEVPPLPPLTPPSAEQAAATAPAALPEPQPAPVAQPAPATPAAPAPPKHYFIERGMSHADVAKMYGSNGQTVMGNPPEDGVVRWQLEAGGSVQVRFKDGVVDRFTSYAPEAQPTQDLPVEQRITRAQYDQITPGMSLYDVSEFLDIEGRLMATGAAGEKVYRWSDEAGGSFSARFENDKLIRKAAFAEAPVVVPPETEGEVIEGDASSEYAEEDYEGEWVEEGEYVEDEYASERPAPPAVRTVYSSRPPASAPASGEAPQQVFRAEGRTRVVGKSSANYGVQDAGAAEETYRDRRRRVRLPEYKHSLRRGVYEIRVENNASSRASVGLRQGKNGKDVTVSPGSSGSFQVDRGSYELFYILNDFPYDLERGQGVTVDGQVKADLIINITDDGASVQSLETPIFY